MSDFSVGNEFVQINGVQAVGTFHPICGEIGTANQVPLRARRIVTEVDILKVTGTTGMALTTFQPGTGHRMKYHPGGSTVVASLNVQRWLGPFVLDSLTQLDLQITTTLAAGTAWWVGVSFVQETLPDNAPTVWDP